MAGSQAPAGIGVAWLSGLYFPRESLSAKYSNAGAFAPATSTSYLRMPSL
jgi:hypothetical protein